MDVGTVVYGLMAGGVFAMIARGMGYRATPAGRLESIGWFLASASFLIVLQAAGRGAIFGVMSLAAAMVMLAYSGARRLSLRPQ